MRRLLLALLALVVAAPSHSIIIRTSSVSTPTPEDYRTIVVFGDIQDHTADGISVGANGRYQELQDQISWVIQERDIENIDAVLFVGDLINAGTPLPYTGCDDWTGTPDPGGACYAIGSQGTCEGTDGCGWGVANPPCAPCALVDDADAEWVRVLAQFARLDAADIPYMAAKGNHDNLGLEFPNDPQREPSGFDVSRLNTAYWDARDGTFAGRSYEHIAENDLGALGIGHAWTTALLDTPILVVSIPYISGPGIDAAHETWLTGQCTANPTLPVIALVHHVGEINPTITFQSETVCPNLIATVGGHVGWPSGAGNRKDVFSNGSEDVLVVQIDYTNDNGEADGIPNGSMQRDTNGDLKKDYFSVMRFWLTDRDAEVTDISVSSQLEVAEPASKIARRSFDITPPGSDAGAPYNLDFWEPRLAALYDNSAPSSERVNEPIPPTGLPASPTAVTTCLALTSALSGNNQWITVDVDIPLPCSWQITGQDILLEMGDSGHIRTSATMFIAGTGPQRVKITGGAMTSTNTNFTRLDRGNDILLKNTKLDFNGFETRVDGGCTTDCLKRMWIVESDIETHSRAVWLMADDQTVATRAFEDLVLAGNDILALSDQTPGQFGFRFQDLNRHLFVDNRMDFRSPGNSFTRHMADSQYHLIAGNTFIAGLWPTETGQTWHNNYAGNQTNQHDGNLAWIHTVENTYISTSGTDHSGSGGYSDSSVDGVSTCNNLLFTDSDLFTVAGDVFNAFSGPSYRTICSPMIEGNDPGANNTSADWSDYPTYPVAPECEDLIRPDLTRPCGADH